MRRLIDPKQSLGVGVRGERYREHGTRIDKLIENADKLRKAVKK